MDVDSEKTGNLKARYYRFHHVILDQQDFGGFYGIIEEIVG